MQMRRFAGWLLFTTHLCACSDGRSGAHDAVPPSARGEAATSPLRLRPWRVLQTIRKRTQTLVKVTTAAGVVTTTPDHLFAKVDGTWAPASRLRVGDAIVSTDRLAGVVITGLVTDRVPGTDVYNLTVERTHTYAVGPDRLLVHNVDCKRPAGPSETNPSPSRTTLAERLAQEREQEREHQREQERRREQMRAELNTFRQEHQQRLETLRRTFNDSHGDTNCVYCTVGGLSDYDKLSVFLKDNGLNEKQPTSVRKNYELLERLKLRTSETPPSATFEKKNKGWLNRENPQRDAKKFMQESSSNTFALIIKGSRGSPIGHSLIAVRKPDGSIVYVDLQKVPPETYDRLNPMIQYVEVIPTDVDWRYNREIHRVVQGSPKTDPKRGWPK